MKIIIEKETKEVVFAGDVTLTADGVKGKDFVAKNVKPDKHELVKTGALPRDFRGRHYTYDGAWHRTATGLESAKEAAQEQNKQDCQNFIHEKYPAPKQRSAAMGIYDQAVIDTMADHIARLIAEENRVFALIKAVKTDDEFNAIESPLWEKV